MTRQPPGPSKSPSAEQIRTGHGKKAMKEARARRKETEQGEKSPVPEIGGRTGPDPARYGDWEVKGIASDF